MLLFTNEIKIMTIVSFGIKFQVYIPFFYKFDGVISVYQCTMYMFFSIFSILDLGRHWVFADIKANHLLGKVAISLPTFLSEFLSMPTLKS